MHASSLASLTAAKERFEPVLASLGPQAAGVGAELFAVVDALDSSAPLRRTLTDPATEPEQKARLITSLLAGRVREDVADLVAGMVRSRWSGERDLADAVEELAVEAVLASAGERLTQVEEEIFRLGRTVIAQRELRQALGDSGASPERRLGLVDALLGGRVEEQTMTLARRMTAVPRGRQLTASLQLIGDLAARRRDRLVAAVTAAVPLTTAQRDRLGAILRRTYGREVQLNVSVDPGVLGGLRVQVGPEVVDATITTRFDEARRRLAG